MITGMGLCLASRLSLNAPGWPSLPAILARIEACTDVYGDLATAARIGLRSTYAIQVSSARGKLGESESVNEGQ